MSDHGVAPGLRRCHAELASGAGVKRGPGRDRDADSRRSHDAAGIEARLDGVDWDGVRACLWERPHARLGTVLSHRECVELGALFDDDALFRSEPGRDYGGGAFLLVEQRPRAQSVGEAVLPAQGEAIVFATRHRPVRGRRGFHRATVRHGVSRVESGTRATLGVIFHDAV